MHLGQLLSRNALQVILLGLQMDGNEDAGKIEHSRNDRADDDVAVRCAHDISHQERRGAHDRRHDLSAGGSGCLNGARELAAVTGLLHQRDRDGTGTDGISDGRAGDHAQESGRYDRDLGGTARETADEGVREIDEEVGNARPLQERAEDDENNNELRARVDRRGQDAFFGIEEQADRIVQAADESRVGQARRQRIDDERGRHDQDRQPYGPSADLREADDADHADRDLHVGELAALLDDLNGIEHEIQERTCAADHQDNVVPGDVVDLLHALPGRIDQVAQEHDAGHEGSQTHFLKECPPQSNIDAK